MDSEKSMLLPALQNGQSTEYVLPGTGLICCTSLKSTTDPRSRSSTSLSSSSAAAGTVFLGFSTTGGILQTSTPTFLAYSQVIDALTLSYPIETVRGRYGGGVKVSDWYHPTRRTLCPEQVALLKKMATSMSGSDLVTLNSIISQFAP